MYHLISRLLLTIWIPESGIQISTVIVEIVFLATGRTIETCNIEGDVATGDMDACFDAENLSKSVIISSDSCSSSISCDVISSDVIWTKSPSSDCLVKIKVLFSSSNPKLNDKQDLNNALVWYPGHRASQSFRWISYSVHGNCTSWPEYFFVCCLHRSL